MVRLHGFRFSNYHNIVKTVLLEKSVEFEEAIAYPPADGDYLAKNPTGKFPCLELADGSFLGESRVILDYLEEAYPGVALMPTDPRALARFAPYIAGPDLSLADFTATFHFIPVSIASTAIYGDDVLAAIPQIARHTRLMDERAAVRVAKAEQLADERAFMERRTA
jgi:glutathione S-transferase